MRGQEGGPTPVEKRLVLVAQMLDRALVEINEVMDQIRADPFLGEGRESDDEPST